MLWYHLDCLLGQLVHVNTGLSSKLATRKESRGPQKECEAKSLLVVLPWSAFFTQVLKHLYLL